MDLLRRLNCLKYPKVIGLVISVTLLGCNTDQRIAYSQISELDIEESVKIIDLEKDPVNWVNLFEKKVGSLKKDSSHDIKINRALAYINKRSITENNPIGQNVYERLNSYRFVTLGQIDSAIHYAQKARISATLHDSINPLNTYQCLGVAYYYQNQNSDSTRKYWQKGYKEAVLTKNYVMIELFASNLGSFYYNNGNTRNARNLFLIASEASLKINRQNSMNINNIICTLMDESEFNQADTFWIKNQKILNEDINSYNGQLYLLNRVKLLHSLGRHNEASLLLTKLNTKLLKPTLQREFAWVSLVTQFAEGRFNGFSDSFLKPIIQENIDYFAYHLRNDLKEQINQPEIQTFLSEINSFYSNTSKFKDLSKTYQSSIYELLASNYKLTNPAKAGTFYESAIKTKDESIKEEVKNQERTIEELRQLEKLFTEIRDKEQIIFQQNKQQKVTYVLFGFVLIIVVLGIWITRNQLKIKNIKQRQLETEQQALIKEKELNNRIVEYSKSMIAQNEKIKVEILNTVATASKSIKNQTSKIFSKFQLSTSISAIENPKIANQLIKEKEDWNAKYPGFNDLNKTEQRVLVLTMENYRTKDISNVLGISIQYVRNVRSRLKRKLNLPNNWGS